MPAGRAIKLNDSQALILKALAAKGHRANGGLGMTKQDVEAACPGAAFTVSNVGVGGNGSAPCPGSLLDHGYVSAERHDVEGRMVTFYRATRAGVKAAQSIRSLARSDRRVDAAALDPVVIAFRPARTYGIENYTDDDLAEIRAALGPGAADFPLSDLRQLIANRRKQGAYADPRERVRRVAKATLQAFGAGGWVHDCLLPPDVAEAIARIARTGRAIG
jgi:DNA-binding PadR family transcriptional regulator